MRKEKQTIKIRLYWELPTEIVVLPVKALDSQPKRKLINQDLPGY